MASQFRVKPRVLETSTITGTGTYTLAGAPTGYQAFLGGGIVAGDLVPAYVTDGTNWEEGFYTVGSGPATLARTHIHNSSTGGAAINWAANTEVECHLGWVSEVVVPRKKAVSIAGGAGTQVLTEDEARVHILHLTGVLTGDRVIEVSATPWVWVVYNTTSGAFSVTLKVNGQTGVVLTQGTRSVVHCDGIDVEYSLSDPAGLALSFAAISHLTKAIHGLTYQNNATDPTNDIDVAGGGCIDDTGAYWMARSGTIRKRLDAAWVVGNNQGALDTGAIGNNDYYIWAIARSDTGVVDALFSLSSTAPTMPANYDYKRLIGWFKRVGGTIVPFKTYEIAGGGLELLWSAPTLDINLANTLTTSRRTDAVKVPLDFTTTAHLNVEIKDVSANSVAWICCPDQTDAAPADGAAPLFNINSATGYAPGLQMKIRTSAAGLIAARSNLATVDLYAVSTMGFEWGRRI